MPASVLLVGAGLGVRAQGGTFPVSGSQPAGLGETQSGRWVEVWMGAAGAVSAVPSGSFLKSGPHLRGSQLSREPDPATFLEVQLVQGDWFRLGSRGAGAGEGNLGL